MPYKDPEKEKRKKKEWARNNPEKVKLSQKNWSEKNKDYYQRNKEKLKRRGRDYYYTHLDEKRKYNRNYLKKWRENIRRKIIKLLGGKCIRCGFRDQRALQIDHIHGGGNQHRRTIGTSWIKNHILKEIQSGSKEYQLLCANCNVIKAFEKEEW